MKKLKITLPVVAVVLAVAGAFASANLNMSHPEFIAPVNNTQPCRQIQETTGCKPTAEFACEAVVMGKSDLYNVYDNRVTACVNLLRRDIKELAFKQPQI